MKKPAKAKPAPIDYRAWKADAAARLLKKHEINATSIPEKIWRDLFVARQATPEQAADLAEVHYHNFIRRPSFAPKKR